MFETNKSDNEIFTIKLNKLITADRVFRYANAKNEKQRKGGNKGLTFSTTFRTSTSSQSFNKHYLSAPFMYYPSYNYLYIWINNKISNFNFLASWKKTLWMLMKIKWNVKKVIDIFMLPNISINNKPNGYKTMIAFQRLQKKGYITVSY